MRRLAQGKQQAVVLGDGGSGQQAFIHILYTYYEYRSDGSEHQVAYITRSLSPK